MPLIPINKSAGLTESEKCLISLSEKSFLNLWAYPNLYKQPGKELCDLLVVCGDHVIVFSDKTIAWPENADHTLSWSRWYKRAIKKSADQAKGAIRWLEQHPEEIYLDAACTKKFPLPLPHKDKRKTTGIVVAIGAKEASLEYFKEGSGSLKIVPALKGDAHVDKMHTAFQPLTIGDINPDGQFIHVFDDVTLDILLNELDTVTDFTDYLDKKEKFMRSGYLTSAGGEEDLLALYLHYVNDDEEHDFLTLDGKKITAPDTVKIDCGFYNKFTSTPEYIMKNDANHVSYVWDRLITIFTKPIMEATTVDLYGQNHSLEDLEEAVRDMALECRMHRRMLGEAIKTAIEDGKSENRFCRAIMPGPTDTKRKTGYVFMMLRCPNHIELDDNYTRYRQVRAEMLKAYCLGHYRKNKSVNRMIGIGMEPPSDATGRKGGSEDLVLIEPNEWTAELEKETNELCKKYDILREGRVKEKRVQGNEYPDLPNNSIAIFGSDDDRVLVIRETEEPSSMRKNTAMNRKQRRAAKAKRKKRT